MNILSNLLTQPTDAAAPRQHRGIEIKSKREIDIMRQAAGIVATVLKEIAALVEPGMTTADLDAHAEKRIREMGAKPSFKGYHGFPASICASVNHEVVHGIPNRKKVPPPRGCIGRSIPEHIFKAFHGDSCITIGLGEVTPDAAKLIRVAEESLYKGN